MNVGLGCVLRSGNREGGSGGAAPGRVSACYG